MEYRLFIGKEKPLRASFSSTPQLGSHISYYDGGWFIGLVNYVEHNTHTSIVDIVLINIQPKVMG